MKFRLLCFPIILFFLSIATLRLNAQVGQSRNDWAIGGNIGMTMTKVLFQPTIRQQYLMQPTVGLTARYTSEKYFALLCAIQFEINYTRLGWKEDIYSSQNEKLADTYQRQIDYLQIPMLASLALGQETRGFKGFILAGPQVGLALTDREHRSSTWTTHTISNVTVPDRSNNVYAQYSKPLEHRFDYGICAGLGIELTSSFGHILFDARYYYGLADLFGNSKRDPFGRSPNNTLMIRASFLFGLK